MPFADSTKVISLNIFFILFSDYNKLQSNGFMVYV